MNKLTKTLLLSGLVTLPLVSGFSYAEDAPTLVPKVSLYSEYEYRGISQTSEKPALQFNLDYSHPSGLYAGMFLTNIKWLKDLKDLGLIEKDSKVELDLFAGYKFEVVKDVTLDIGYLRYEYPGMKAFSGLPKANTDEVYLGASYGPVSAKYSYSFNDTFGTANSEGSDFIELNYAQEVAPKLTLTGHVGRQKYKGNFAGFNNGDLTYTVYKIGASYDLGGGWATGGYFKDTNAKKELYTYKDRDWSKGRLVAFVSKSF